MQESILYGGEASGIDDIAWTQDPDDSDLSIPGKLRLFSIASSPSVTEWDLVAGKPKARSSGNFSEVWAFAAQPRVRPVAGGAGEEEEEGKFQDIVAGCGDGALVLFTTEDGEVRFKRVLVRVAGKKARCMCITWQTRDRVVAGFADGMVRVFDARNGSCLVALGLGSAVPGAPRNALVWKVRCLSNGDIVAGDSNGELRVWDGKLYAQLQRLSAHDTDCLDLVTSADGKTILSGSMDGRIAMFRQTNDGQGRRIWAKNGHRRVHQGEVKGMAAFDSKSLSVMVSGGADIAPVVSPLREYGRENQRSLPSLPQDPPITSAPRARLLVSWWETDIYIWRISRQQDIDTKPRKLVARISLKKKSHIRHASISNDGRILAVATGAGIRVFQLRRRLHADALAIRRIILPKNLAKGAARLATISPDAKWLVAVTGDSEVHITRITAVPEQPKLVQVVHRTAELERQYRRNIKRTALYNYDRIINRVAFSPDSCMLVASDLSGYLDSWQLQGDEDSTAKPWDLVARKPGSNDSDSDSDSDSSSDDSDDGTIVFHGQQWSESPSAQLLPKLDSAPLVLTFRPSHHSSQPNSKSSTDGASDTQPKYVLWCMSSRHHMYEFDILAGRLSDWSRRNPTAVLPPDFVKIRERVVGAVWDVENAAQQRIWLYGSNFVFMLNVGVDLDDGTASTAIEATTRKRKRRRRGSNINADVAQIDGDELRKQRKLESGAGNLVNAVEVVSKGSIQQQIDSAAALLDSDDENEDGTSKEGLVKDKVAEDDEDDEDLPLTRLRRDSEINGEVLVNGVDHNNDLTQAQVKDPAQQRKWWVTFKYRPILGMVPLELEESDKGMVQMDGKTDNATGVAERPIEVVLVERPMWDVLRERKDK